jgi:hypothetical protein
MRKGFFEGAGSPANSTNGSGRPATVEAELLSIIRSSYPKHSLPTTLSVGYMYTPDQGISLMASMMIETAIGNSSAQASEVDIMGAVVNEKGTVVSTLQQHLTSPPPPAAEGGRLLYTMEFPNLVSGLYQVRLATRDSQHGLAGDARQWIEIPDTGKGQFLLGSVFLSEVRAATQKAVVSPARRFARTSRMRFQGQVYNAEHSSRHPELTLEVQLAKDGQVVIATPPTPISVQGLTDFARIPFIGEFPLSGFQPGEYELKLTITDLLTKANASRRSTFTVQ